MDEAIQQRLQTQTEKRVALLKNRAKRCVCKYCGGPLRLKQITFSQFDDARIEIFCQDCDRLEFGVEPEIYHNACFYVEETRFNCYPDLDDSDKTRQMTIAKVCEIMTWEDQAAGILTPEGFAIVRPSRQYSSHCLTFSEADLAQDDEPQEG